MPLIDDVNHILMSMEWMPGEAVQDKLSIVSAHRSSNTVMKAIKRLHAVGLLTGENGRLYFDDLVASRSPESLSKGYVLLHEHDLLSGEGVAYYRGILKDQKYPNPMAKAFDKLATAGLLSLADGPLCTEIVINSPSPEAVADAFILFNERGLLTEENIRYIEKRRNLQSMVDGIKNLKEVGLLEGERGNFYFNTIILQQNTPRAFTWVLMLLHQSGRWDDRYFELLNQDNYPREQLARALNVLNDAGILGGASGLIHLNFLLSYPDLQGMSSALMILQDSNLLAGVGAQNYCDIIYQHATPYSAALALSTLHKAGLMDEWIISNVLANSLPNLASQIVLALNQCHLLSEFNYLRMINHTDPHNLQRALSRIISMGLLEGLDSEELITHLLNHTNLFELADGLDLLGGQGLASTDFILLRENFSLLLAHPAPRLVASNWKWVYFIE